MIWRVSAFLNFRQVIDIHENSIGWQPFSQKGSNAKQKYRLLKPNIYCHSTYKYVFTVRERLTGEALF